MCWFPSPCWGLFFYRNGLGERKGFRLAMQFPSPCWGLFFYLELANQAFCYLAFFVSVPVLGIIFLSLPSIVMITSAFKLRLSAEFL